MIVLSLKIRLRTVLGSFSVRFPGAAPLARFKVDIDYSVFVITMFILSYAVWQVPEVQST